MGDEEFAMPLAPSRAAGASRPAGAVPATPLTNRDFRQLLMTPRAGAGAGAAPRPTPSEKTPARTPSGGGGGGGGFSKPRPKGKPRPKKEGDEEEDEGPKYVDRAKLRRQDEQKAEEGEGNLGVLAVGVPPPHMMLDAYQEQQRVIQESKYLGGDFERTHLVKGLDVQLRDKTLEEMRKAQAAEEEEREAAAKAAEGAKGLSFASPVAQGVHRFFAGDRRRNSAAADRFAVGRVAFVFQLEEEEGGLNSDIPTTVVRAKTVTADTADMVHASVDGALLERLGGLMSYLRLGNPKLIKKLRRKEREASKLGSGGNAAGAGTAGAGAGGDGAAGAQKKAVDADEDIFGDAGTDYKPTAPAKKDRAGHDKQSYFGEADAKGEAARAPLRAAKADQPDQPPPPPGEPPPQYYAQHGAAGFVPPPPPPGPDMPPMPGPAMPGPGYNYGADPYAPAYPAAASGEVAMYPDADAAAAAAAGWGYDAYGNAVWDQNAYAAAYYQMYPGQQAPPPPPQSSAPNPRGGYGSAAPTPDTASALLAQAHGGGLGGSAGAKPNIFARGAGSRATVGMDDERRRQIQEAIDGGGESADGSAAKGKKKDEAYMECYAGYGEFAAEVVSDDEDEELAKLDAGNLKGLSRKDFQSEEEYSAYKAQQEANPKGSFQFGVKGADGRMKGKERDKKQSAELQKVRKMLTEQHGDKYENAFKKPSADDGGGRGGLDGGKTPRHGGTGPDAGDASRRAKRLKL